MIDQNLVLWDSGDGEEIATKIAIAGDFLPAGNLTFPASLGWSQMPHNVAAYFKDVSTTFVNLECALPDGTLAPRPLAGIGQTVRAHPESLEYLRPIRAHAVGIANNHSYDFS